MYKYIYVDDPRIVDILVKKCRYSTNGFHIDVKCKACPEDAAEASGEEEVCELLTRQRSTVERHLREEHKLTIENYEKAVEGR